MESGRMESLREGSVDHERHSPVSVSDPLISHLYQPCQSRLPFVGEQFVFLFIFYGRCIPEWRDSASITDVKHLGRSESVTWKLPWEARSTHPSIKFV